MGTRITYPIIGGTGDERLKILGSSRTINLYEVDLPTPNFPNTQIGQGLMKWPGSLGVATFEAVSGARAAFVNKRNPDQCFFVVEDEVFTINSALTIVSIATLTTTTGHVGIDQGVGDNGAQIIFVDGVKGYVYDYLADTWTEITDPSFPAQPIDVVSIDGYALVAEGETNKMWISQLDDFTVWPGGFFSITSRPDVMAGLGTANRLLYAFGKQSTEIWYDAGIDTFTNDVPFRRYNTTLPPYGCASVNSIASGFGFVFFLARDENGLTAVIKAEGTNFTEVTTPDINYQIDSIDNITDARGNIFEYKGNVFYQLSFTSGDRTFVYHINKNLWYELRQSNGSRHKMQAYMFFNNKHYFGGYDDNILYELNELYFDNNGDAMPLERISGALSDSTGNKIQLNKVKGRFAQGVGNYLVKNSRDPTVELSISRDNGRTFGYRLNKKLGAGGNYNYITEWVEPFGANDTFNFKITYYARTQFAIVGLYVDIDIMEN